MVCVVAKKRSAILRGSVLEILNHWGPVMHARDRSVLVVAILAVGPLLWWAWPEHSETHSSPAVPTFSSSAPREIFGLHHEPGVAHGGPIPLSRRATRASAESGETTPGWAELSPHERLEQLEGSFETALGELEAGDPSAQNRAADALTALRFELYTTATGQARHAELEQKLDRLTEEEAG
jgi:hypothetical protein